MRIRILKNAPTEENCSDITEMIGQEFEVSLHTTEFVEIKHGDSYIVIFNGEYEELDED